MPKYLFQAVYTTGDGVKGLIKDGGSARRTAVGKLVDSLGGRMESFYYAFGSVDAFAIAELPDDASAAAASLAVGAPGTASVQVVVLIEPETIDEASKKAIDYRPPGA